MKSDLTSLILTFVLGMLAILGVVFAVQTIFLTREFRSLNTQASYVNTSLMQAQSLAADVAAYNAKSPSPELTKLLTAIQPKPAAR